MTPAQIRAARAGLGWTQLELAQRAGVHARTIKQIEAGRVSPMRQTKSGLAKAFTAAGVGFAGDCSIILPDPGKPSRRF